MSWLYSSRSGIWWTGETRLPAHFDGFVEANDAPVKTRNARIDEIKAGRNTVSRIIRF
jgi:hypothetical protein